MKIPRVIRHFFKGKFLLPDLHRDTPRTFAAKKGRAVAKVTPLSVVHPATANILLRMGTRSNFKCFLDQWLIWSAVSALSLYVLSVLANYILWFIINSDPNKIDRIVLLIQEALSLLLAGIEVVALFACSFILYPKLVARNYEDCDPSTVHFCAFFFSMMWLLILLACISLTSLSAARCLGIGVPDKPKDLEKGLEGKPKLTWGQIEEKFYSSKSSQNRKPDGQSFNLSKYYQRASGLDSSEESN